MILRNRGEKTKGVKDGEDGKALLWLLKGQRASAREYVKSFPISKELATSYSVHQIASTFFLRKEL